MKVYIAVMGSRGTINTVRIYKKVKNAERPLERHLTDVGLNLDAYPGPSLLERYYQALEAGDWDAVAAADPSEVYIDNIRMS